MWPWSTPGCRRGSPGGGSARSSRACSLSSASSATPSAEFASGGSSWREGAWAGDSARRRLILRLRPLGGARPPSVGLGRGADGHRRVHGSRAPPTDVHPPAGVDSGSGFECGRDDGTLRDALSAARIVGAELDPSSAELCRKNVRLWGEQCSVIPAGVWNADGPVSYIRRDRREVSHAIATRAPEGTAQAHALSMTSS